MSCCEEIHKDYDSKANREIQLGELPPFMHVKGRVAWYVYQGPYEHISSKGWDVFWQKFAARNVKMEGAPGDVYVCSPSCHKEDRQAKMLTVLWAPIE
jgi:hypothetical protein